MSKFDDTINAIETLLCEKKSKRKSIPMSKAKSKVDSKRKRRSENVEIEWLEEESVVSGKLTRNAFSASSKEQSESEKHEGYLNVYNKSGRIEGMECGCSDYQANFKKYNNDSGISSWNDQPKVTNGYFDPHSKNSPEVMNPDDDKGIGCKHLIKAIGEFSKK